MHIACDRTEVTSRVMTRRVCAIAAMLVALAIAGCGSDDEQKQTAAPVQTVKREKAPEDPTAKMAHAVTIGKSTVPVDLRYDILSKPIAGTPVEIELALVSTVGADSMGVSFTPSTGLTLSADTAPNFDTVKAGQPERVKFTALAKDVGVFYVTVTATLYNAGTSSPRTFALPIITSAATDSAAAAPAAANTTSGQGAPAATPAPKAKS